VNFFQPSFKLKEKRREGAKVIDAMRASSGQQYRALDPVALLAEIRAAQ
jgi:hypothetical protein